MKKQIKKKIHEAPVTITSKQSEYSTHKDTLFVNDKDTSIEIKLNIFDFGENQKDPIIEITSFTANELTDFNSKLQSENKAAAGFKITINGGVIFIATKMVNGAIEVNNLFDELIDVAGSARQADAFLRSTIDRAQRYAHGAKQNLQTYNHFFGALTEDQKKWMEENTVSYEHEIAVAKESARLKNGGSK